MTTNESLPYVSVVVPVYNGAAFVADCVRALLDQTYPSDLYEIIVVDNGSTDNTLQVLASFGESISIKSQDKVPSSYAARNVGVRSAAGTVIAFTDSDCTPDTNWMMHGVAALESGAYDIMAGRVSFAMSSKRTWAEQLDSLTNMHNASVVSLHKGAKTANVFVRKELFETYGLFDQTKTSGEDLGWTTRVTRQGGSIGYTVHAVVSHPARGFWELMKKQRRVGTGSIAAWRMSGRPWWHILGAIILHMVPVHAPLVVYRYIRRRGVEGQTYAMFGMTCVYICTRYAMLVGMVLKRRYR